MENRKQKEKASENSWIEWIEKEDLEQKKKNAPTLIEKKV